jgi:MFS transporter, putative metabolite:H+ symporter
VSDSSAISVRRAGVGIPRPWPFWVGFVAISAGVAVHVPMFLDARDMDYMLHGMGFDAEMLAAMSAIMIGLVLTGIGLVPRRRPDATRIPSVDVSVDEGRVGLAHAALLSVLTIAVVIDAMKPAALAFVAPGMRDEYGLGRDTVGLLPLMGASGMVIGALLWGHFGDQVGRRAAILYSGMLFTATAVCGAMPYWELNLLMCFFMGVGVGGMIPITFALLAETIPSRHRGFAMVMVGVAVAAAYALTSALSDWLVPELSWRILFLIGLPTGVLLILLNPWIPESPRFLVGMGHRKEAEEVLRRFGAELRVRRTTERAETAISGAWRDIASRDYLGLTVAICLVGFSAGFLTFGFQLWVPSSLTELGVERGDVDGLVRNAAFIAIPVSALIAPAYGYWSSKGTIVGVVLLVLLALVVLVVGGEDVAESRVALYALIAMPIAGASSLMMIVAAYSSEVFPTEIRARGGGAATSASRAGGVLIVLSVVFSVVSPSIEAMALAAAGALVLALAFFVPKGIETRQRTLETITREELGEPFLAPERSA